MFSAIFILIAVCIKSTWWWQSESFTSFSFYHQPSQPTFYHFIYPPRLTTKKQNHYSISMSLMTSHTSKACLQTFYATVATCSGSINKRQLWNQNRYFFADVWLTMFATNCFVYIFLLVINIQHACYFWRGWTLR